MHIGLIGIGHIRASMAIRMLRGQHERVVHDRNREVITRLVVRGGMVLHTGRA